MPCLDLVREEGDKLVLVDYKIWPIITWNTRIPLIPFGSLVFSHVVVFVSAFVGLHVQIPEIHVLVLCGYSRAT